jgi:hypothetical protein
MVQFTTKNAKKIPLYKSEATEKFALKNGVSASNKKKRDFVQKLNEISPFPF